MPPSGFTPDQAPTDALETRSSPGALLVANAVRIASVAMASTPVPVPATVAPSTAAVGDHLAALRRAWHPVAIAADVGVDPTVVTLLSEEWAVWRDADGMLRAFLDRCPHRLAPISTGTRCDDGTLRCNYHGWRFDPAGACTQIPALGTAAAIPSRARLTAACGVAERGGLVWLAPEEPIAPLVDVDPPDGAGVGMLAVTRLTADPGNLIDNFLDVAHFPFVHAGTFGLEQSDQVDEYDLLPTEHGFVAVTEHEFANHEDPGVKAGLRPLVQRRRMTYTYAPPFTTTLRLDYVDAAGTNLILFGIQPERPGPGPLATMRVFTVLLRNDVPPEALAEAIAFEQRVLDEDVVVQTTLPTALPLDLTTEVHTKADKLTIELRRTLARLLTT